MANELMLIQAVSNVSQAITSLTTTAKTFGRIHKQDIVIFEEELLCLKYACRARGYGTLTRLNIEEIEKTFSNIKQKNYSGIMLDMAMELLNVQMQMLRKNIENYV